MKLLIITNLTDQEFIGSDNPVIIDNKYQPENGLGFDCGGVLFFVAISPKKALLMLDSKMYPKAEALEQFSVENIDEVNKINEFIYFNSSNIIFSKSKETLKSLYEILDRKYVDRFLRKICEEKGMTDPILQNIRILKIKQSKIFKKFPFAGRNVGR